MKKNGNSEKLRQSIQAKISEHVYTIYSPYHSHSKEAREKAQLQLDEIGKQGLFHQYLIDLYTLQLRIRKEINKDLGSDDKQAKNLNNLIHIGYIPNADPDEIDLGEKSRWISECGQAYEEVSYCPRSC